MQRNAWFSCVLSCLAIPLMGQTLTVNKVQETPSGQQLDSTNVSLGIPMVYRITITSSDANKNPTITVTDDLPPGFMLIQVDCSGQLGATCPNGSASQTNIGVTGDPLVIGTLTVPGGTGPSLELRITGYFTAPNPSLNNHVEAIRNGESVVETTAKDDVPLTNRCRSISRSRKRPDRPPA